MLLLNALRKGLPVDGSECIEKGSTCVETAPAFERHKAERLGKASNACSACVGFTMVYKCQMG